MQFRTIKRAFVTAAAVFGLAYAVPGCTTHGRGVVYVTDAQPPPPRYIQAPYRPGHVYIQGHWEHRDRGWAWRDGYYSRERPGHVYIQGRWHSDSGRWRWSDGRWDRRGSDEPRRRRHVRDHRPR